MALHLKLVQAPIVEAAEFRCQAAERSNERELRRDLVCDEAETCPARGLEVTFSFHLQLVQPGSRCKAQRDQVGLAEGFVQQVAALLSQIECALHHRGRGQDVSVQGKTW